MGAGTLPKAGKGVRLVLENGSLAACLGGRQWWLCHLSPEDTPVSPQGGAGKRVVESSSFCLSASLVFWKAVMSYTLRKEVQGGGQR